MDYTQKIIELAKFYIAQSNKLTTVGMERVFAENAIYLRMPEEGEGPDPVDVRGRSAILEAHQSFFDQMSRAHWDVPDANYHLTAPNTVEFHIDRVEWTTIVAGQTTRLTASEKMVFNEDGLAVHVSGELTSAPVVTKA